MAPHSIGPKSKIPPVLRPEVLAKVAAGEHYAAIVEWLKAKHGLEVGEKSVSRLVRKDAAQNAEVVKASLRRSLRKLFGKRFGRLREILDRSLAKEDELEGMLDGPLEDEDRVKVFAELRKHREEQAKVLDLAYHYAGADQPDKTAAAPQNVRETFAARLKNLVDRAGQAREGQTH